MSDPVIIQPSAPPMRLAAPWWVPNVQGFLAAAIILLIMVIVIILLLKPPPLDDRTSGLLMTVVGVLIACLKDVYGFVFGSSASSQKKDETIAVIATPRAP